MNEGTDQQPKPKTRRRRRSVLLVLLFLLTGLCGLLWLDSKPREPSYHDEPLSVWLSRAVENGAGSSDDKNPRLIECREAIRSIGTNAIPVLLRVLRAKDSALKRKVMDLAERQNLVDIPFHSAEDQKEKAQAGLYLLGELATNVVPDLIDISQHPPSGDSKEAADNILMSLYPAKCVAIPYWVPGTNQAKWYFKAGVAQFQRGNNTNAILAFSQAIDLEPTNSRAWGCRAAARAEMKDLTQALGDYERASELSPTNSYIICGRGSCRFGLKDFRGAEADFTAAINLQTNDPTPFNDRALTRANLRDFDGAVADFDKAIELAPLPVYYRSRAGVEVMQGEYESALEDISKSIDMDSKDPVAWATRGRVQNALKNYKAAIADAERALQLDPKDTNANAYICRATSYLFRNEFEKSAADLETALKLNSRNASAFLVRGFLRVKRGGEDDAVLADFERAAELSPRAPEPHGMLGGFQYQVRKWNPALTNCRKALELGALPYRTSYHCYIWLIRAQSGEQQAANQELRTFLKSFDQARTNEWSAINARFLLGDLPETNYFNLAITAAKRPSAVTNQIADSFFYAAMKRKIAGDKVGAIELLQKCLDTKEDNAFSWMNAGTELRELKGQ